MGYRWWVVGTQAQHDRLASRKAVAQPRFGLARVMPVPHLTITHSPTSLIFWGLAGRGQQRTSDVSSGLYGGKRLQVLSGCWLARDHHSLKRLKGGPDGGGVGGGGVKKSCAD